jgi:phosphoribosyl-AMP cyclohydrolase
MENFISSNAFSKIDFLKLRDSISEAVVPVVVQHIDTKEVLLLAYVNEFSLKLSIQKKQAVFWSTSRNELWHKGSTSGDFLNLCGIKVNCKNNTLLFFVRPENTGVCHVKDAKGISHSTCFFKDIHS